MMRQDTAGYGWFFPHPNFVFLDIPVRDGRGTPDREAGKLTHVIRDGTLVRLPP